MLKLVVVCLVVAVGFSLATTAVAEGPWQKVENNANCSVWNASPQPNETVTWTGSCVKGMAHGYGTEVWRFQIDGAWKTSKYEGEKRFGRSNGQGTYVAANGNRYDGEYKDGKKHGRGVYVWANGNKYDGEFRDGKRHGRGVYVYGSGNKYEGEFRDGKRHGRGVFKFPNGDECGGEWRRGTLVSMGKGLREGRQAECYFSGNTIKYIK
jgi:hypothetical protein